MDASKIPSTFGQRFLVAAVVAQSRETVYYHRPSGAFSASAQTATLFDSNMEATEALPNESFHPLLTEFSIIPAHVFVTL